MKNIIKSVLIFVGLTLLLLASCTMNKDSESEMVNVSFSTAANINEENVKIGRSVSPDATSQSFFTADSTVYVLSGKSGQNTYEKECTLQELEDLSIKLSKGEWTFNLSVYRSDVGKETIYYSAEITIDLQGDSETISFTLKSCTNSSFTGDIEYYFTVPLDYEDTPEATLKTSKGETLVDDDGNAVKGTVYKESEDKEKNTKEYYFSFKDIPVDTYKIALKIPSTVKTTGYSYSDDENGYRTFSSEESEVTVSNARPESGILVMPELLTSNKNAPRDFTKINQLVAIEYKALLISDSITSDNTQTNLPNADLDLFYNASIGGYLKLHAPEYVAKHPSNSSWEYEFKKWETVKIDADSNRITTELETATDNGETVWLLPRSKDSIFNYLEAVYEKSNCKVTLNLGDATWTVAEDSVWKTTDTGITGTAAYNTTVTIPGSSNVVPKMTGWTFVGFSATETAMDKTKKSKDDFSDYISLGESYTITGDVTLYPLWYYNGQCNLSSSYTTPNETKTDITFDDDGNAAISNVVAGTTIALSSTTTNATIKYLVSETELPSVSVSAITSEYTTEIKPTDDCFIYAYVSDSTGVYENSDIYKITVTMNKADITLALSDFNFELIMESGTDGNTKTFTIQDAQTGDSLDAYKDILTVRWYLNDIHKSAADNTFSLTIKLDSDMDLQESNIVRAEISYNGLYQTISEVFGL